MIVVKDKFSFLRNIDNILHIPKNIIDEKSDELNLLNMIRSVKMIENSLSHFSNHIIFPMISTLETAKENIHIISDDMYPLPISYNKPTDSIVFNLAFFDTDSITKLSSKQIYSTLVFGECFRRLVSNKYVMKTNYVDPIINFLGTVFIRIFGKEFGLLGSYQTELSKVKFLLSCYIYQSFIGLEKKELYKNASNISGYDYKQIEDDLNRYNFYMIDDFIKALSELNAMKGITKYSFASKILKFLGINFICALEDISRFLSLVAASSINGSTLVPSFFHSYNSDEYKKLLKICEDIFKRR